jgi:hypothetical protein
VITGYSRLAEYQYWLVINIPQNKPPASGEQIFKIKSGSVFFFNLLISKQEISKRKKIFLTEHFGQ